MVAGQSSMVKVRSLLALFMLNASGRKCGSAHSLGTILEEIKLGTGCCKECSAPITRKRCLEASR